MPASNRSLSPRGGARPDNQNYESLSTPPPRSRGPRQSFGSEEASSTTEVGSQRSHPATGSSSHHNHNETPLPKKQLAILAFISLCEQTALNSISPYLPEMVASFPDSSIDQVGLYVGAIASAFALAQFLTNYFWGKLSDSIGRKPVVLIGTISTAIGLVGFGFSTKFWHAVVAQSVIGLMNGNQGVVSTCLGEITDKSNQSKAFTYLPVIYGLGGITGPIVGGFFSDIGFTSYPYLLPNLIAAAILVIDFIASIIWLDESLETMKEKPNVFRKISNVFTSLWQFVSGSHNPTYLQNRRRLSSRTRPALFSQIASLLRSTVTTTLKRMMRIILKRQRRGEGRRRRALFQSCNALAPWFLNCFLQNRHPKREIPIPFCSCSHSLCFSLRMCLSIVCTQSLPKLPSRSDETCRQELSVFLWPSLVAPLWFSKSEFSTG